VIHATKINKSKQLTSVKFISNLCVNKYTYAMKTDRAPD